MQRIVYSFAVMTLLAGCGAPELQSQWRGLREIRVDGQADDWSGVLEQNDELDIDFGVLNDGEYLYIALAPLDPARERQIMMGGLTFWFDPEEQKKRSNGIRYPVGTNMHPAGASMPDRRASREEVDEFAKRLERRFYENLDLVTLVSRAEWDGQTVALNQLEGIEAAAAPYADSFFLEIRIPLFLASGVDVGARAGESLAVGLQTADIKPPDGEMRGAPGGRKGSRPGGRMGGRPGGAIGGRRGGGMGSRPGAMTGRGMRLEPLEAWVKLTLARAEHGEAVATTEHAGEEN